MCGIAGRILGEEERISRADVLKMQSLMRHRGPDGGGTYWGDRVALTMRRLSIIDIAGGNQPLFNEDRSVVLVGNGEIYNYKELRDELRKKGHHLKTRSDIETVAHLYEDLELKFVEKLRGMFALAIYDKRRQKVILVRDRLGEKPLYWTMVGRGLAFASELKVLVNMEWTKKKLDPLAIDSFFHYYYVPEPKTMFVDIHKLPPASMLVIDLKTMDIEQTKYWRPEEIVPTDRGDLTGEIRDVFRESCELTLRSDVPVGVALSGGVDSGSILSLAAPAYRGNLKAFSIGYEGTPPRDERQKAKWLAKRYGVKFIEKEIKHQEVVESFPQLIYEGDDPIADIAGYGIHSVSKLAHENQVPVLLGGLGGDELFWGYSWTSQAIEQSLRLRRMCFFDLNKGFEMADSFIRQLYTKDLAGEIKSHADATKDLEWKNNETSVAKMGMDLIRDVWLVSNCIDQNERLSMANSVELRSPFLDYKLTELILGSRQAINAYNKPEKYWLKKAMKGILPDEVMRRKKQGFTPPVSIWIMKILRSYIPLIRGGFLVRENILDERKVEWLARTWMAMPLNWYALYQIVLLEIWGREYYYGQSPEELR
ncbi:MAG: asparagine synthase (glutamine-hydrolyzing) [Microgenomates group bacterium]